MVGDAAREDRLQIVKPKSSPFEALAEPTRRAVVEALVVRPQTPGELASQLKVSPQALSRHLRLLRRAGFIRAEGLEEDQRQRVYRIDPTAFKSLRSWLERAEDLWAKQLAAFKHYADRGSSE